MQCIEIMEQNVQFVNPDDEVASAAKTMRDAESASFRCVIAKPTKLLERLLTETLPSGLWRKGKRRRFRFQTS